MGLMVCLPPPSTPHCRLIRQAPLRHAAGFYFTPLSYLLLVVCTYVFCKYREFQISRQGARRQAKQCSDSWLFPLACCQGAFNNYVDQILTNFDPLPPSSGQAWTFYIPPLVHVDKRWTKAPPLKYQIVSHFNQHNIWVSHTFSFQWQ